MASFDLGDVVGSLQILLAVTEEAKQHQHNLQFEATFALFLRAADFWPSEELLPVLVRLRQLAALAGNAQSLSALHLAVARLEGMRGHCVDAHRHLEIARRLAEQSPALAIRCSVDLVEASLEIVAGNLVRARQLAEACFRLADAEGFQKYKLGSATNLGVIALYSKQMDKASDYLFNVAEAADAITYVKFGVSDSIAALELERGEVRKCSELLDRCTQILKKDSLPARSWYDLAHDLTRCAYFERLEDWTEILAIADAADAELVRRQYKAIRTSLLCAKARALAHLGRHNQADTALATAVRVCPRGAVDPLIVLETSKALAVSLRGDVSRGAVHFDRALAATRAIGHKLHEAWIERLRAPIVRESRETIRMTSRPTLNVTDASMLVSDIATMLGAGHSIDLLAQRMAAILQATTIGSRVDIESESGCEYQPDPTANWDAGADGTFRINLRGSDRRVAISVAGVQSIDEISLLKSVADLVQAAVNRTADTENEDEDQNLWPRATLNQTDDAIFRSPRMAELLRIAIRLANSDLPILISGETGTGKEVIARLIHDHSPVRRGPFVAFNCSSLPRELVESQLFGHRRGAFTGALDSFPGVVRAAEHGTLFLDELGDLDLAVQPKLLRFLERAEIHALGESRPQQVSVRIVAATNVDVDALVGDGRFRRDLFYRLGAHIGLPPLRERKDEIPALATLFLNRYARECQRNGVRLGDDFIAALLLYDWPGNIRQLANEVRRVVAMAEDGETIRSGALAPEILVHWNARATTAPHASPVVSIRLDQTLAEASEQLERAFIERAMTHAGGRVAEAAQMLGLSRKGLFLKRRRQGLMPRPVHAN